MLLDDNCVPHGEALEDPLGQVEVIYLPPNCTSKHQPMDAGIIAAIKKNARTKYLLKLLRLFDEREGLRAAAKRLKMPTGTKGVDQGYPAHIYDAMGFMQEAWDQLSSQSIAKCWRLCDLRRQKRGDELIVPNDVGDNRTPEPLDSDTKMLLSGLIAAGEREQNDVDSSNDLDAMVGEMLEVFEQKAPYRSSFIHCI